MRKSEILAAPEKIHGDPEISVRFIRKQKYFDVHHVETIFGEADRINEYPRPEIVVIEK